MVTIEEIIDTIEKNTNEELARYIKDDIITSENFGLDINQARFLMEIANRLEDCTCSDRDDDLPPFLQALKPNGPG